MISGEQQDACSISRTHANFNRTAKSQFGSVSSQSVFIRSVFFYNTSMKNTSMRIWKSNSNNVLDNMSHEYKNAFNINKLLKRTYNLSTKKKYYNKLGTFH